MLQTFPVNRFTAALFAALLIVAGTVYAQAERPHVILIMADDIGVEGFGCYGGASYQTPHIDAMARRGVRFTHAYSQPLCTNTRLQIMTGLYNFRNWTAFGIMPPGQRTFGHLARDAGYRTAMFGKWQLQSYDPPDFPAADRRRGTGMHPGDAGFDEYAVFHGLETEDKGSRYASPTLLEGTSTPNGRSGDEKLITHAGKYGEDIWSDRVIEFVKRPDDRAAFVYYPMALPHRPFQPPPNHSDFDGSVPKAAHLDAPSSDPRSGDAKYFGHMVQYLDKIVGKIIDAVDQAGLMDDTIILFYSDNGTHQSITSRMQDGRPVVGGKSESTQRGIHVPLVVLSPSRFKPHVRSSIVDSTDFYPTLAQWMGATSVAEASDGTSFANALVEQRGSPREAAFFWYDPRPGWDKAKYGREVWAVNREAKLYRDGRYLRLTKRLLEEIPVPEDERTEDDQQQIELLQAAIDKRLTPATRVPPLVDAYGNPIDHPSHSTGITE